MPSHANDLLQPLRAAEPKASTENNPLPEEVVDALIVSTAQGDILLNFQTGEFTMGRDTDCDLVLNTRFVSRRHARIIRHGGRFFFLEDLSRNGTTIRPQGLEERILRRGERFALVGAGLIGLGEHAEPDGHAVLSYKIVRRPRGQE